MNMENDQFFLFSDELENQIQQFKLSLISSFYTPDDIVPDSLINDIESNLERLKKAINILHEFVNKKPLDTEELANALNYEPSIMEVVQLILGFNDRTGLMDGRDLGYSSRSAGINNGISSYYFSQLIHDIGFFKIIPADSDIKSMVRMALIAQFAPRRPYRALKNINYKVSDV
jgi:hypothetical protein